MSCVLICILLSDIVFLIKWAGGKCSLCLEAARAKRRRMGLRVRTLSEVTVGGGREAGGYDAKMEARNIVHARHQVVG